MCAVVDVCSQVNVELKDLTVGILTKVLRLLLYVYFCAQFLVLCMYASSHFW